MNFNKIVSFYEQYHNLQLVEGCQYFVEVEHPLT